MKLSLFIKFSIPLVILFILSGFFLSYQVRKFIADEAINSTKILIAELIKNHAQQNVTSPDDFSLANPQKTQEVFNQIFEDIKTKDLIRIKVWDKNATIVFADDQTLIGQKFPDNEEFQEAIEGKTTVEIKEPLKQENISEKGYGQLMELYVPIRLEGESVPSGVIEVYYSMDRLNESILKTQFTARITIAIAFLVLSSLIWFLLYFFVLRPLGKLETEIKSIKSRGEI